MWRWLTENFFFYLELYKHNARGQIALCDVGMLASSFTTRVSEVFD
jgi:hypothetical protein